ncbi:MAG: transglycosylase SLT domain-containing protein, partial [Myxococcota bacterium]
LGAFYLGKLNRTFSGHLPATAAAYNAGPFAVRRWLSGGETETDLFVARIPYRETRNYVQRVLTNLARYRFLAVGVEGVPALPLRIPAAETIGADAY